MMELLPYEVEIPCVEKLLHDLVGLGGNELSYVPMVSTMLKVLLKQLPIYSHYQ
uniref:Without annotation or the blast of the protein n=1 Tax=Comamonas testosteroni TaxID=285 RepID=A0A6H1Q042_COMTE|nr:without annotation or the blast of the protein [Comamonas testosteroni]